MIRKIVPALVAAILPVSLLAQSVETPQPVVPEANSSFVRHQTLMGLAVYAPSLALAVTEHGSTYVPAYLLSAGVNYFAVRQLARFIRITPEMNSLASHMSLRGSLIGGGVGYATHMSSDATAAGILIGGLGGTTAGLLAGSGWSRHDVVTSQLGADISGLAGLGITQIVRGDREYEDALTRGDAALVSGMLVSGYVLGRMYGNSVSHNETRGDGASLWITGALGAAAASISYSGRDVGRRTAAAALTLGGLGGVAVGELLLARRFDLSSHDATFIAVGTGAGGLLGFGMARLFYESGETDSKTMTLATAGGIVGLFATHYFLAPPVDGGRASTLPRNQNPSASAGVQFNPAGLALTAAQIPGTFPLLRVNFK